MLNKGLFLYYVKSGGRLSQYDMVALMSHYGPRHRSAPPPSQHAASFLKAASWSKIAVAAPAKMAPEWQSKDL